MRITKQQLNKIIIETGKLDPRDIPTSADYEEMNLRGDYERDLRKDRRAEELNEPLPPPPVEIPHALDQYDDVMWDEDGIPYRWDEKGEYVDLSHLMEYKMRITKRHLKRIIGEETQRLAEDHIDTELDHLKKNIGDDLEHIKDLKYDIKDDHEEELRAEKEKEKHESRRYRAKRLRYNQLRRMIREDHEDWGMGKGEESRTHPGEEDYTGHEGDLSKTHPGEDYEGGDATHKAHAAMAAVLDLADAAGVELGTGPSDEAEEEVGMVALENRRRRRRLKEAQLRRIIRRVTRRR